jgi:hypothetical protein
MTWLFYIYVAGGLTLTGLALAAFTAASLIPQKDIDEACKPLETDDHDEPEPDTSPRT